MDAWLAFARSGDPSHPAIGGWPPYDAERRATMELGERCGVVDAPFEAERRVMADVDWGGRRVRRAAGRLPRGPGPSPKVS
jgi:para-nitrobenzyl esterase